MSPYTYINRNTHTPSHTRIYIYIYIYIYIQKTALFIFCGIVSFCECKSWIRSTSYQWYLYVGGRDHSKSCTYFGKVERIGQALSQRWESTSEDTWTHNVMIYVTATLLMSSVIDCFFIRHYQAVGGSDYFFVYPPYYTR